MSITASRNEALESKNTAYRLAAAKTVMAERARLANIETGAALEREATERKKAEAAVAEHEQLAKEAKAVSDFLALDMIGAADRAKTLGRQLTVRQMLDQTTDQVGSAFPGQPRTEASVGL